jgi:hypothetical protein
MELRLVVAVAVAVLAAEPIADACAPAPPVGEEVVIADEEAIIVWDARTSTEHFIRRAQFSSTAKAFGFLVPTPSKPKLGEIDDSVFGQLAWQLSPEVVVDTSGFTIDPSPLLLKACMLGARMKGGDDAIPPVDIMQSVNVAGFDATTLRADTPEAISAWLGEHGFATTPQLTEWLGWYVEHHWMITAFVVSSKEANSSTVTTSAVRMSFKTEKPFYPYREPAPIPITTTPRVTNASRLLRVFFLSNERYAATLGDKTPWSARVLHASPLTLPEPLVALKAGRYATVFHDDSNPRVATDELYFARSADQKSVRQTVTDHQPTSIPLMPDVWLVVGFIAWRIRRRRKRRAQKVAGTQ